MANSSTKSILLNQKGFSITSVVIAMTLLSVITLGVASLTQNSMKTVTYLEDKLSAINLQNELNMDFSDSQACKNTLQGLSTKENQTVENILSNKNKVVYRTPSSYDRLNISGISLEDVSIEGEANTTGRMDLKINLTRDRPGISTLQPISIPLSVSTNGDGDISSCVSMGKVEEDNSRDCTAAPGNGGSHGFSFIANDPSIVAPDSSHNFKSSRRDPSSRGQTRYVPKCNELKNTDCSTKEGSIYSYTTGVLDVTGSLPGLKTVSYYCDNGRWHYLSTVQAPSAPPRSGP